MPFCYLCLRNSCLDDHVLLQIGKSETEEIRCNWSTWVGQVIMA